MPTTVETKLYEKFFYVRFMGEYDYAQAMIRLPRLVAAFVRSGARQVLFDALRIEGPIPVSHRMEYYSRLAHYLNRFQQKGQLPSARVAWVVPPNWIWDGPFEQLVENAGFDIIRVDSMDEALSWLGIDPQNFHFEKNQLTDL